MHEKNDPMQYPTISYLVGKNVYLRPMEPEDNEITYLWFLHSDPQSQTSHQPMIVTPKEYVEARKKKEKTPQEGDFMIVRKEDNQPVGKIRYFDLNLMSRSAEFGYIVAPDQRRKGYAREGLTLIIRYLFTYYNLNKIYAQTAAFNTGSVELLKSLDFKLDGTLRQNHFYRGILYDDFIYSLLKFECNFLGE
jgi:ribosomal-protein-alanine N-acetyltransferase